MLTKLFNAERSEEIGVTNEFDFPPKPKVSTVTELSWVCVFCPALSAETVHGIPAFGGMCSNVSAYCVAGVRSAC